MMIRFIKMITIHLFNPSLFIHLSMCVEMCYDVFQCVNGFLFRSLLYIDVPVHVALRVYIGPEYDCYDTHLQQKREGKMELMFLCMKKVKNIYSKVAAAWI